MQAITTNKTLFKKQWTSQHEDMKISHIRRALQWKWHGTSIFHSQDMWNVRRSEPMARRSKNFTSEASSWGSQVLHTWVPFSGETSLSPLARHSIELFLALIQLALVEEILHTFKHHNQGSTLFSAPSTKTLSKSFKQQQPFKITVLLQTQHD